MITSDLKLCRQCGEEWPADTDFFFADSANPSGLFYCCKACYTEKFRRPETRRKYPQPDRRPSDDLASVSWLTASTTTGLAGSSA